LKDWEEVSGETPQALQDMPDVKPHQGYYLAAYRELDSWRGYTSDGYPAPISLADMAHYFWINGVPEGLERQDLMYHVKRLDVADMNHRNEKAKHASEEAKINPEV
jgi:hypothetical protein